MLTKNKDHFVSIGELFDPSTAANDLSSCSDDDHSSRWGVVWAEATVIPPGEEKLPGAPEASTVTYDDPECLTVQGEEGQQKPQEPPYCNGHFVDVVLGSSIAIAAVASTFGCELAAAMVFTVAAGLYSIGKKCCDNGGILHFIFMPVLVILLCVDALLLALSVLLAELMACLAWCVCSLFGGFKVADGWRQYIRRICHLSRWAFRDFHSEWSLQRTPLPCCRSTTSCISKESNEVARKGSTVAGG